MRVAVKSHALPVCIFEVTIVSFFFSFGEKNLIGLVFGANVALSAVVKSEYT